jgi:acetyl-CoA C-acetyltransferase
MVAVKNHAHGSKNPSAQYPFKISIEDVMKSPLVADSLRLLDCSPITDGAAAIVLCSLEMAKSLKRDPIIKIIGSGQATDFIALHNKRDITWLEATAKAAERAYKMADKSPEDIDFVEVHDCFTIAEICVAEALGFFGKDEGGKAVEKGLTSLGGKIPVNPSGGLKSKGHPVGATGVAQVVEVVRQLREEAGERQVNNAQIGMTQNMGGTGGSCLVHIFEKG